jgi:hypothetical protein
MTIFPTFRPLKISSRNTQSQSSSSRTAFFDDVEPENAYSLLWRNGWLIVRKMTFFRSFRHLKFSSRNINGRVPVRELTIFGSCGTREIVFLLPTKQTAYRSRIKLLYDVSAPEKFPPEILNCRVPVREVTIFGLSEPRKAHSLVRGNCQLTVKK